MRLLVDQDIYKVTTDKLREWGHEVVAAKELEMQQAADEDLLRKAKEVDRLFITRDKGFGSLVFLKEKLSTGVILLRVIPGTVEEVHRELWHLLDEHPEDELKRLFCVVEARRHRIRRLAG